MYLYDLLRFIDIICERTRTDRSCFPRSQEDNTILQPWLNLCSSCSKGWFETRRILGLMRSSLAAQLYHEISQTAIIVQKCVAVKPLCGDKPSTIRLTQVAKAPKSFKSCADSTPSAATQPGYISLRRFAGDSRDSMVLPLCLLDPDGY